jgi:hypothetical protein
MKIFISGETDGQISKDFGDLLREIAAKVKTLTDKDYGSEFTFIGIIPVIIDPKRGLFENGFFKERVLIKRKAKEADIRLRTDFDKFFSADFETKRLLFIENIIRSIKAIAARSKSDFNSEKLIKDILEIYNIEQEKLDQL